jgi:aminoglycoside phosphotransferase (APT) family kinase protein
MAWRWYSVMNEVINHDTLQRIWQAHGLGAVRTIQPASRGMNNRATVVNDSCVIRFDLLDLPEVCRYVGEKLAYERLRAAGIPAPEVVALDVSKTLVPYHYIILTRCEGRPLIDDWPDFSATQQAEMGRAAGHYLAMMHEITFDGFGKLSRLATEPWPRWYDHVEDFLERFAPGLVARGTLESAVYERMRAVIQRLRPLVDFTGGGRLVHSDYQFENLLHHNGVITAIIDFEWSIAGDPAWDFKLDEQWDDDCPGSAQYIHEGYTRVRPLPADHRLRVWLYKLLHHLDSVDMYAADPGEKFMLAWSQAEMLRALTALEQES